MKQFVLGTMFGVNGILSAAFAFAGYGNHCLAVGALAGALLVTAVIVK